MLLKEPSLSLTRSLSVDVDYNEPPFSKCLRAMIPVMSPVKGGPKPSPQKKIKPKFN